ncbi:lipopolysaccharide biosynthesis protein [Bosea psychrotolerans]|uniref:O-antigen/teichoic acid export membrane protein n=1 Tax=Bosea psychrotolerans TaxID=1871628 RepID=A0A2S4LYM3_9HYPH|nr:lipopolysaccharide biosynthesis protein [Bosea psychrotolerans]POR47560.1 O-antigen/teichoic acid export membrane protein [Bosea psychrotolerans]
MALDQDMPGGQAPRGVKARFGPILGPALSFGDQALSSACNFLTTILLARALGLEAFGLYTMVWLALYFAMSLQLGLIVSPMMSIGAKEEGAEAQAYYTVVFLHQAGYVAVAAVAIFAALTFAAGAVPPLADVALPGSIAAAAYLTQDFLRRYLFARRRPAGILLIDTINQALKLGALAALWHAGMISVAASLWAVAGAATISAICGLCMSGPFRWKPEIFAEVTGRQWRSARWLVLTGSVQWVLSYSGLLVTAGLFGPKILGALRAAQSVLAALNVVREALDNVVPPLAGQAFAEGGLPGLRRMLGRAVLFATLTGASAVIGLGLFGPWLLHRLYGGEILEFDWVIVWYSFAFPMALMTQALGCAFRALERTRPIFFATFAGGCLNLLAVYPAAAVFGVAGLIAVTLLSELTVVIVLTILIVRVPGMMSGEPHERTGAAGGGAVAVPLP